MEALLATDASLSLLILRVVLGVIFFAHGAQKVLGWYGGHGLKGTVGHMTSMGLPLQIAYLVCFAEFLGGIGLVLGLLTRLAALAVGTVMAGAIKTVHWQNGLFINWELAPGKGHGIEANLAFLAIALAIFLQGAGPLSIDRLFVP
jgi:putative oxidoreductase